MKRIMVLVSLFLSIGLSAESIKLTHVNSFNESNSTGYHWTHGENEDGGYYIFSTPVYMYRFCSSKDGAISSLNCYYIIDEKQYYADIASGLGTGDGFQYIIETKRVPDSKKMWSIKNHIFTFETLNLSFALEN